MSNVGYATLSVIPSFNGFRGQLERGTAGDLRAAGRAGGRQYGDTAGREAGDSFKKRFSGAMKSFAGVAGVTLGGAAIVDFFKDAVGGASDLNEAGTKLQAIYGEAAAEVQQYASTAAESLGQTRIQALDAAATFGTFGKAAGLAGSDLAGFSTELVTLATDMASFYNSDVSTAIEAIGSGLRGEAEPLRAFGVLLDDATLRAEALRQGLVKTTKDALTPQQKVLAAHAVIMAQTTDAQGDFERTGEGLANQQRKLTAQWEEMKVAVGEDLLPAMTSFVSFMNDSGLPALGAIGGAVKDAGSAFVALPAPIIAATGAFVALRVAAMTGLGAAVASGAAAAGSAFVGLRIRALLAADAYRSVRAGAALVAAANGGVIASNGRVAASFAAVRYAAAGAGAAMAGGMRGALALVGGPWGAAFIGATALLTKFWMESREAKQRIESLTGSLDAQTGEITRNTREMLFNTLQKEGALDAATTLGISLYTLRRGLEGEAEAMARVNAVVDEHNTKIHLTSESLPNVSQKMIDQSAAAATLAGVLGSTSSELAQARDGVANLGEFMGQSTDVTNEAADATSDYGDALKKAKDRLQDLIDKEQERADNAVGRRRDQLGLVQALADTRKELNEGKRTLDISTLAGQANREALYDLADQWNQSSEAVRGKRGAWRTMRQDFIDLATAMGGGGDSAAARARKLAEDLLRIPKPKIDTSAIDKAKEKVRELQALIDGLEQGRKINLGVPLAMGAPTARLNGGPVSAGTPYLVGERRPEVFVPDRPGRIEPRVSGGNTINVTVVADDPWAWKREMDHMARSGALGGADFR